MKLLFDLFPVILFFVAFKMKGIFVATAVAIAASFLQIGWVYLRKRKVEPMLWVGLCVIVVFGGATLLLKNELFIKWKPTVLYTLFASVLLVSDLFFRKNLLRAMLQKQVSLPDKVWKGMNLSWGAFFLVVAGVNLYVAYNFSTSTWVNFKLFGIMGLMLAFIVAQGLFISRFAEEKKVPGQEKDTAERS